MLGNVQRLFLDGVVGRQLSEPGDSVHPGRQAETWHLPAVQVAAPSFAPANAEQLDRCQHTVASMISFAGTHSVPTGAERFSISPYRQPPHDSRSF